MQEIKVTMLGATGVGKTTLLTAVYEQFQSNIGETDLQLTADEESSAILQERLAELKTLLNDFEATGGIKGTEGEPDTIKSFNFDLGRKGEKPSLKLQFFDYPGGYHITKASPEKRKFVKDLIKECAAVLIVIDAPSIMEQSGIWHERINRPQQITDLFKAEYQNLDSPKLVILAPVKCEKYLQNEKSAQELLQKLKQEYTNLIDFFSCKNLQSKVAVVVTPVQTVGSVVFSRLERKNDTPCFFFRKISHDAKYSPKDSEQPLRYLLRFVLKMHLDQQAQSWGIFGFIRDWLGFDEYLKSAISKFASGCKKNDGFAIIQGESLLKID